MSDLLKIVKPQSLQHLMRKLQIEESIQAPTEKLVDEISEAIDVARENAIVASTIRLQRVEAIGLAQWLIEAYSDDIEVVDFPKINYVKNVLLNNYRGSFQKFVQYFLVYFGENHYLDALAENLITNYFNKYMDTYPINQWIHHKILFQRQTAVKYIENLFREASYNINQLCERYLPISPRDMSQSTLLQSTIKSIYQGDTYSYAQKLENLPVIFGTKKDSVFTLILGACLSPLLEALEDIHDKNFRVNIRNYYLMRVGNPRQRTDDTSKVVWKDLTNAAQRQLKRMFAQDDLDFFFSIVSSIDESHMWSARKQFWQKWVEHMDETYVYFSIKEQHAVNRHCEEYEKENGIQGLDYNWVKAADRKCAFIFRIQHYWVIEWSSSGYVYIYNADKKHPSDVFREYDYREIDIKKYFDVYSKWQKKHIGHWTEDVADHIYEYTGIY